MRCCTRAAPGRSAEGRIAPHGGHAHRSSRPPWACRCVGAAPASAKVSIEVLSNRAEAISGGDALVAVNLPEGHEGLARAREPERPERDAAASRSAATAASRACSTGLRNGANTARRAVPGGDGARITIRNHPIGGPVTSGPQIKPWTCFPGARDAQCNRAVDARVPLHAGGRRRPPALRPREPAVRRGHHHHRPGQEGAVHRAPGDAARSTATSTGSRCSSSPASRGSRGRRSRATTTSWSRSTA